MTSHRCVLITDALWVIDMTDVCYQYVSPAIFFKMNVSKYLGEVGAERKYRELEVDRVAQIPAWYFWESFFYELKILQCVR